MKTRDLIVKSWEAAKRRANADYVDAIPVTPATMAGLYLDAADGDAERANALVPDSAGGVFFPLVRAHLAAVLVEERSERGPRLKTGTEGR